MQISQGSEEAKCMRGVFVTFRGRRRVKGRTPNHCQTIVLSASFIWATYRGGRELSSLRHSLRMLCSQPVPLSKMTFLRCTLYEQWARVKTEYAPHSTGEYPLYERSRKGPIQNHYHRVQKSSKRRGLYLSHTQIFTCLCAQFHDIFSRKHWIHEYLHKNIS